MHHLRSIGTRFTISHYFFFFLTFLLFSSLLFSLSFSCLCSSDLNGPYYGAPGDACYGGVCGYDSHFGLDTYGTGGNKKGSCGHYFVSCSTPPPPPQNKYSYVTSEFCGSVSGRESIGTAAECTTAAASLGSVYAGRPIHYFQSAKQVTWPAYPAGCFTYNNFVAWNTLSTTARTCDGSSICICATSPHPAPPQAKGTLVRIFFL